MYKYYITNMFEGAIEGTNDKEVAYDTSMSTDYFVLETATGKWVTMGEPAEVKPFNTTQSDELES